VCYYTSRFSPIETRGSITGLAHGTLWPISHSREPPWVTVDTGILPQNAQSSKSVRRR
jgi:hypothetical protein